MANVVNTSFRAQYNEPITAAKTNAKFTDYQTESADIDSTNIKAQGVDRINLQGQVVKTYKSFNNNSSPTALPDVVYGFNTLSGRAALERSQSQITHGSGVGPPFEFDFSGSPITLAVGDFIRVNYTLGWWRTENQQFDKATGDAGTAPTANERDYRLCWLVNPAYLSAAYDPVSGPSLWNNFPNKVNWMINYEKKGPDTDGPDRYQIPTGDNPVSGFDDGIVLFSPDGYFDDPKTLHEQTHHGVWSYQNTSGSPITLYKVGFFIQGPLKLISQIGSRNRGFEAVSTSGLGTGNVVNISLGVLNANLIIYEKGAT